MKKGLLLILPLILFAGKNHATIVNDIEVAKDSPKGTGLATVEAEVDFNVAPGKFHPHNQSLTISKISIQGRKLPDNRWQLYEVGSSCLVPVQIGEQLRIKGKIDKKIHIYCEKTRVKN